MTDRPRLTVDLEPAQKKALKLLIPWGAQRLLISKVITLFIKFLADHGFGKTIDGLTNDEIELRFKSNSDGNRK